MSLAELVPALHDLPRDEKLEVIRLLATELTRQEGIDLLQDGASYPVWTPLDAFDAAKSLQQLLDQERVQFHLHQGHDQQRRRSAAAESFRQHD